MMKEFKPKQLSKEELDKQIQLKLKLKHPELFLSKEESEKWLEEKKDETDVGFIISSLVDDYSQDIEKMEREKAEREKQLPKEMKLSVVKEEEGEVTSEQKVPDPESQPKEEKNGPQEEEELLQDDSAKSPEKVQNDDAEPEELKQANNNSNNKQDQNDDEALFQEEDDYKENEAEDLINRPPLTQSQM